MMLIRTLDEVAGTVNDDHSFLRQLIFSLHLTYVARPIIELCGMATSVCARLASFCAFVAATAGAQQAPSAAVLRIEVVDSSRSPVQDADVRALKGPKIFFQARTTVQGVAIVLIREDVNEIEVVVRKLGFRPEHRVVRLVPRDTMDMAFSLSAAAQALGTVQVTARESLRRRSYYLDAESIANSTRRINSALDAITALRPFMLTSIGGRRVCGLVQEVWINGMRIPQNFPADPLMENRILPGVNPRQPVAPQVLSILSSVRPEHIQEMSYIDCFGGPVNAIGSRNAVFIVLKEGIEYRWPVGTFVVGDSTSQI